MSDRKDKQLNNDDLKEVKSLIGDVSGDEFSLDDILAEYGSGKSTGRGAVPVAPLTRGEPELSPDLPWPEPPRTRDRRDKVVHFPGMGQEPAPEEPEEAAPEEEPYQQAPCGEEPEAEEPEPLDEEPEEDEPGEDRVIEFPEEESVLTAFLKDVGRKADDYADRMFEEDERTDPEQVRRLERLIPGTDREDELE